MIKLTAQAELANRVVSQGRDLGLGHLKVDEVLDKGKSVIVNGKKLVSFSNCGYLGLEFDPRLLEASKNAIDKYGSHFSSSRSFLELSLFDELETLLSQIFDKPTLYVQSTTLAHLSLIPTIFNTNDALILDHRVHNSVGNACGIVKSRGTYIELIRHNNMDMLESRIQKLYDKYERIWYMADGVYSMLGDTAPTEHLNYLMDKYEKFYVYYDDAHGMSWTGKSGAGYVLSKTHYHPKMLLVTSLGKGFGSLGGAIVMPDKEMYHLIRNIGATLMFCIQPQPATVAAAVASAKIHLSDEIYSHQDRIKANMSYFKMTAKALGLPLVSEDTTPIFYMGGGTPEATFEISKRLVKEGFYINSVVYPAVPHKNTGMRISVTANHSHADIFELLNCIAAEFSRLERKNQVQRTEIIKAFALAAA